MLKMQVNVRKQYGNTYKGRSRGKVSLVEETDIIKIHELNIVEG